MKLPEPRALRVAVRHAFYVLGLNALLVYAVYRLYLVEHSVFAVGAGLAIPFLVQGLIFLMPPMPPLRPWPMLLICLVLLVLFFFCPNFWAAALLYAFMRLILVGLVGRILPREESEKKIRHFITLWGSAFALAASSILLMFAPPALPGVCFVSLLMVLFLSLGFRLKPGGSTVEKNSPEGERPLDVMRESLWILLFMVVQTAGLALLNLESFSGGTGSLERVSAGGFFLGFFLLGVNLGKISWHPLSQRLRGGIPYKVSIFVPGIMIMLLRALSSPAIFMPFLVTAGFFLGLQETAFFALLKVVKRDEFPRVYRAAGVVVTWAMFFYLAFFGGLGACCPAAYRVFVLPAAGGLMIISALGEFARCRNLEINHRP